MTGAFFFLKDIAFIKFTLYATVVTAVKKRCVMIAASEIKQLQRTMEVDICLKQQNYLSMN